MHGRPTKLDDSGLYATPVTALGKAMARALIEQGEFLFSSRDQILDAFGQALERSDTQQAISNLITFTKELDALGCGLQDFGYRAIDESQAQYALTYTVASHRFDNDPLWVNEVFTLDVPLMMIINRFATDWNACFARAPMDHIREIADGR